MIFAGDTCGFFYVLRKTHIEDLLLERKLSNMFVSAGVEQYFDENKGSFGETELTPPLRERIEMQLFNDWLRREEERLGASLNLE